MLAKGVPQKEIRELTGITDEDIIKLKKNRNNSDLRNLRAILCSALFSGTFPGKRRNKQFVT